jgi:hypothetical protein
MPVVAVYYIFNIVLVSISVKASVHILNINFRGSSKDEKRVPNWLKKVLFIKKKNERASENENDAEKNISISKNDTSISQDNNHFNFNIKQSKISGYDLVRRNSLGILNNSLFLFFKKKFCSFFCLTII